MKMGVWSVNSDEKRIRRGNPFRAIYIPPTPDEIIEPAIKRAKSVSPETGGKKDIILKKKTIAISRIKTLGNELSDRLIRIVKQCPSIEMIHPFYLAAMETWLSKDEYKKALAKIHGASKLIQRLMKDYIIRIKRVRKTELKPVREVFKEIERLRREAYGRMASVVKSLKRELNILTETVKKMKKLPDYDPELPTIVVTGPPNTGKSSFVKAVSNAKVEIASYPFTTKNITFGHIEFRENDIIIKRAQIVDTPGLFDRPLEERKEPELLALKAIRYLADVVLFLFDGSHEAAVNLDEQFRIYETVNTFFQSDKKIVAINKIDIMDKMVVEKITNYLKAMENIEPFLISVKERRNIDKIVEEIRRKIITDDSK